MGLRAAFKALLARDVPKPGSGYGRGYAGIGGYRIAGLLPGAKFDYRRDAGDRWKNVAVAVCLGWLATNAGQACLDVIEPGEDGDPDTKFPDDPAAQVVDTPNPFWTWEELVAAYLMSDSVDGNSYFIRANGSGGEGPTEELWWVPWWMMGPYADASSTNFIDGYWYQPGDGKTYKLPIEQVIHIKNGVDPYDTRYGCAPLAAAGDRSISGLNACDTYTVAVVKNGGPLRLFIPDGEAVDIDESVAEGIKSKLNRGDRAEDAGTTNVLTVPGRIEQAGSGPQELALDSLPDRLEANVCALMGLNGMVTGLAVGDQTRTFSNLKEAESQAWTNGLIPRLKRLAAGLTKALLADGTKQFAWDYAKVKALSEDETEKVTRAVMAVGGPIATENEGRKMIGLPPVEGGDATPSAKAEQARQDMIDAAKNDPNNQDPNQAGGA